MKKNKQKEFLVVYEDVWSNKESFKTTKIGDTIKIIMEANDLICEDGINFEKYNSDNPYQVGTFGYVFYDIIFQDNTDNKDYAGRIMIFEL